MIEVWPDNMPSVNVFIAMGTQWRAGNNGATGLDYAALPVVMDALLIPSANRPDIFMDLMVMEGVALDTMRRQQAS